MAKAIIVVQNTYVENNEASIGYTASVIKTGNKNFSYSGSYQITSTLSLAANLSAWRSQVINQIAEESIVLTASDIIIFGAPV